MTFITTYTGRRFYPLDPNPSDVCIEDIAHALAMICRFCGHTREFYSVAEHSVHVSRIVPPEYALAGLLHDASEAYIADVSAPLKRSEEMRPYRNAEAYLQRVIEQSLDTYRGWSSVNLVSNHSYRPVARADVAMLALEARSLLPYDPWMDDLPASAKVELGLWGPSEAKRRFLERYAELTDAGRT